MLHQIHKNIITPGREGEERTDGALEGEGGEVEGRQLARHGITARRIDLIVLLVHRKCSVELMKDQTNKHGDRG